MTNRIAPKIDNAPGIVWRPLINNRWQAKWQARTDLRQRGFVPKTCQVWVGTEDELGPVAVGFIQNTCNELQTEMLVWGRGGAEDAGEYTKTLKSLIAHYRTDPDSGYHKGRPVTRTNYDSLLRQIEKTAGDLLISEIRVRHIKRWSDEWIAPKEEGGRERLPMGHACITMLRTVMGFGAIYMEDDECARVGAILHGMKFKKGTPSTERLTADQAIAIRAKAHEMGRPSIALAQAFQFEVMLRQKDVIGEWVAISEKGASDVTSGNRKWLRGMRWSEIDGNLTLKHITSKRLKEITMNLRSAPMVMEEFARIDVSKMSGPVIVSETTLLPYDATAFRYEWRKIADACGIPKSVKSMHSRAGGASEALLAGAPIDSVRKAMTHSTTAMTAHYSRGDEEASEQVAEFRKAYRNKTGTN